MRRFEARSDAVVRRLNQGDSIERLNRLGISRFEKAIPRAGIHPDTPTQLGVKLPRSRMAFRLLYGKTAALGPRSGGPTTIQPHRRGQLGSPLATYAISVSRRTPTRTASAVVCAPEANPLPVLKKFEHHAAAVALYFMHCNVGLVHQTLRVTPVMESGSRDSRVVGRRHSRLTATEVRHIGNRHHEKITGCSDYRLRPGNRPSASINRTIELMRHMMNWAVGREYLDRTPFRRGTETLIRKLQRRQSAATANLGR